MSSKERIEKFIIEGSFFLNKDIDSSDSDFISWNNSLIRFCENEFNTNVDYNALMNFKKKLM